MEKSVEINNHITTKSVFIISVIVTVLTIISIWLFGLGQNRTIFENSILSTTLLSGAFFIFLTIGLYKGVELKENVGSFSNKLKRSNAPDFSNLASSGSNIPSVGDGIEGIIFSIVVWIVATFIITIFFWLFGIVVWTAIIAFIAILYWIFFRALKMVFKNANKCKGDLLKSISYAVFYTILYNCWIYAIIFITGYLNK